jgi:hypothetical protein
MSLDHAWEKLYAAVLGMARSEESLQMRVKSAYVDNLTHIEPVEDELPKEVAETMMEIEELMHRAGDDFDPEEGQAVASARLMTDLEAYVTIEKIVSIYDTVCRTKEPL